jgi:hypothetical protein
VFFALLLPFLTVEAVMAVDMTLLMMAGFTPLRWRDENAGHGPDRE